MAFVRAAVASATIAWTVTAPIFRASLGTSALSLEFSLLFLGYPYGVPFFAPSVYSPLLSLLL